jgi:AcrR family transcriptional regulator
MPVPDQTLRTVPRPPGSTRWAGVPTAERRSERRRLLLDAALELFGTEGDAATSVRAVCKKAQLNARYFYESFADRDELLGALYDQQATELFLEIAAGLGAAGDDLAAGTRAGIETVFRFVAADPRRAKVLYTEAIGNEALARRRHASVNALITAISQPEALGGTTTPALESIDIIAASMFTGGVNEILVGWIDGRIDADLDQLVDDAVRLSLAVFDTAAARAPAGQRGGRSRS